MEIPPVDPNNIYASKIQGLREWGLECMKKLELDRGALVELLEREDFGKEFIPQISQVNDDELISLVTYLDESLSFMGSPQMQASLTAVEDGDLVRMNLDDFDDED